MDSIRYGHPCTCVPFQFFSQVVEQYGSEVADDILKRPRSNMELGAMHSDPSLGQPPQHAPLMPFHVKHDSVNRGTLDSGR
jgi:hypothetical protein